MTEVEREYKTSEAQRRAFKKYKEKDIEEARRKNREYQKNYRMRNLEEYRAKERERQKLRYHKLKNEKLKKKEKETNEAK